MIDKTLDFIRDELNSFLDTRFPATEEHLVLASLVNQDRTVPAGIENKISLSLVNIERETVTPYCTPARTENEVSARIPEVSGLDTAARS